VKLEGLFHRRRQAGRSGDHPRYVFVVTYGRSGSTLTQGLLNALPGALVRGENSMFLLPLYRSWAGLVEFQGKNAQNARKQQSRSAFYGLDQIDADDFVTSAAELAHSALYGSADRSSVDVLGFKEVMWHRILRGEQEQFFDWFEQIFPGATYVLNTRPHEQVMGSGFWQNRDADWAAKAIGHVEDMHQFLRETRPGRTHDTRYELMTSDDPAVKEAHLRALAEFVVGRCDDKILADMHATLDKGHGPRPFGKSRPQSSQSGAGGAGGSE
jgi:hypothetical protein